MGKKLTFEEFEEKAHSIHKKKYTYFLYFGNEIDMPIFCPKEGHGIFWQKPNHHLRGQGCKKCGLEINRTMQINNRNTNEKFIELAQKIHKNKYEYISQYFNAITKIKIICPIHGEFEQTPNAHLSGKGCRKCDPSYKLTFEQFKIKAEKIHGNKYEYYEYKDCKIEIPIMCKIHGIFWKTPDKHLHQSCGCPECHISKGEMKIKNFLHNNKIRFVVQKKFDDCRHKNPLPFDFYLLDYNFCIEYDGLQHFEPVQFRGMSLEKSISSFEKTLKNDQIKNDYCKNNNINLIRISYTEFENIETILNTKILKAELV